MNIQYNLITLANKAYYKFLVILVNSITDKCDMNNIDTFYIIDTGLTNDQKIEIQEKCKKITIISSGFITDYDGGPWGTDWITNVKNKTTILYNVLSNCNGPVLLLDSDTMVVRDLSLLLEYGGDIQVCERPGNPTPYIGSYFLALNKEKALQFVYDWSIEVQNTSTMPPESPSLVKIVNKYDCEMQIVKLGQSIVNVLEPQYLTDDTIIIHFKGSDLVDNLDHQYNTRIEKRGWSEYVKKYIN
jgi:hypothetical protein